jgi:hypothetical protein
MSGDNVSGSCQGSFDFDDSKTREHPDYDSQVWLFAADAESQAPRKPKCIFLDPVSGASAIKSSDLVLVRAYRSFYDLYTSADANSRAATASYVDGLLTRLQSKSEKTANKSKASNAIMVGFVPGAPRAPGVLQRDRMVECRTEFERLLHRLLDAPGPSSLEFAKLINRATRHLEQHSHPSAYALFLERYADLVFHRWLCSNDARYLEDANKIRQIASGFFRSTGLICQAERNTKLVDAYSTLSKQLTLPGLPSPTTRSSSVSGVSLQRVAGFHLDFPCPKADIKRTREAAGPQVFRFAARIEIASHLLLSLLGEIAPGQKRIVARTFRTERQLEVIVEMVDDFEVFSGLEGVVQSREYSCLSSLRSSEVEFTRDETLDPVGRQQKFTANIPPGTKRILVHAQAQLDSNPVCTAIFEFNTPVGGQETYF